MEKATFGAGCFWGIELAFSEMEGVISTKVGYLGGSLDNPTYQDVCSGSSGHAEVVEIEFDPEKVKYEILVNKFWVLHNPTTMNRQGPDIGSQYRSGIFYHTDEQMKIADNSKRVLSLSGKYNSEIVTEITGATEFYIAEDYHQDYLKKRGRSSCSV